MSVTFDNMKNQIGTNVFWYRKKNGQSITDMAEASGVTVKIVSDIETYEQKTVTGEVLTALAYGLGVEKDILIGDHRTPIYVSEGKRVQYQRGLAMAKKLKRKK